MTAVVVRLPSGPTREVVLLKRTLRESVQLGLRLRVSGADIEVQNLESLPDPLRSTLQEAAKSGLLWSYLGGDEPDEEALDLADELGIEAVLVETAAAARGAVRQLIADLNLNGRTLAADIETAPKAEHGEPRPWVHINLDGSLSAHQPEIKDRAGLDPHQANIELLQLYAGGQRCFLFRGEALQQVLHSHWLRRQRIVARNASF